MAACPAAAPYGATSASKRKPGLLDLFREHGPAYEAAHRLSPEQRRFLGNVRVCRTAALGGHLYVCEHCGQQQPLYNSCRNRHCPACQALDQARWIERRTERLLPVGHHHVTFTLPSELRPLAMRFPHEVHGVLFRAVSETLQSLARDRWNAQLGITAVLHTWTRELHYHPHVHTIVTAGALGLDHERWIDLTRFLFPVRQMRCTFASKVRSGLEALVAAGKVRLPSPDLLSRLPKWRRWVIHVEKPFGRSTHVLQYLGRYTHRVAISDTRVEAITETSITFRTRGEDRLTLAPDEFIRRFLLHILPKGFHKIRHFGLYASPRLATAKQLLADGDRERDLDDTACSDGWADLLAALTGEDPLRCPHCQQGRLIYVHELPRPARAPP